MTFRLTDEEVALPMMRPGAKVRFYVDDPPHGQRRGPFEGVLVRKLVYSVQWELAHGKHQVLVYIPERDIEVIR